jgi:hypothetical protein
MFGLSSLELRLAFYGVLLAAIGGWLIYERHHLIAEGEARIKAQDATARADQKVKDDQNHAQIVNELQADNASLRTLANQPVHSLRLCIPSGNVRALASTTGAQSPLSTPAGESGRGVLAGATELEIGPTVSDIAWAQGVVSSYRARTWEWAVSQAK